MKSTSTVRRTGSDASKKTIIIYSILVLAVLVVGFAVYAILVTPSKQPYRDALAQYRNVYNANVALMARGGSLNATTASDEQFTKNTDATKSILDALKAENDLLGTKEVLKDGEGKELYDSFTKQLEKYLVFNRDMLTSMQKVRPVIYGCSAKMSQAAELADEAGVTAMRECADKLAELETVPNADYQQLVKASRPLYADFASNLEKRTALADPQGADADKYNEYSSEQESIFSALNQVSDDFARRISESKRTVDITDRAMALEEFLKRKSRVF